MKYAKTTVSLRISVIQSFYNSLPELDIDFIIPKKEVQYHNRDITKDDILKILAQSCSRDRAIFCLACQSGVSPQNVTLLKWKHIKKDFHRDSEPFCIELPREISKSSHRNHFSFYGEETRNYLKAYFDVRGTPTNDDEYVFLPNRNDTRSKDERLSRKSIATIFSSKVRELGLISEKENIERKGKPKTLRLYNLRKYFRKFAGLAGADFVNFWMGHSASYKASHIPSSDVHYFSGNDIEFHRKIYNDKALPHLKFSERDSKIKSLEEKLDEKEEKIKELESRIPSQETIVQLVEEKINQMIVTSKFINAKSELDNMLNSKQLKDFTKP